VPRAPASDRARAELTPSEAQSPQVDVKQLLADYRELAARVEILEQEMAELKAML
jgi:hypothetical protein